ncbi:class II aldolase/adducin family protein [Octadecabacter sp. G9-8]|uniref:Class II aldolase/adducin family protein n=1 Tax=Octadecabacter dasysiphoniae TaxID=2909341 RepID=A0ABS9CRI1_9RHOB|nr:class II aldolase/adducin family protein [Octadecabacter dasysiphoniae]MCF2869840.1 class II aldolase/adducin family protein [Octadecabacter dasysiphoniae]
MNKPTDFAAFCTLSAALGSDPLRVQGPGGNTSIKDGAVMWIKASGTELADAEQTDIFVAVDRDAARAQAFGDGDGSCKDTVLDPANTLRPSIETTFHAALDWAVVAHTHSIASLTHSITPQGRAVAAEKLSQMPAVFVPYAKPGLPLTREILARITPETQVIVLENHGLICCGATVQDVTALMENVETLLAMPVKTRPAALPTTSAPDGFHWAAESWIATDPIATAYATGGSYYPDHVVFLGPALPRADHDGKPPAVVFAGVGVALRDDATPSQRAMLKCLSDVLSRLPNDWTATPIGNDAEAELLNWDAEKYRQALAARS